MAASTSDAEVYSRARAGLRSESWWDTPLPLPALHLDFWDKLGALERVLQFSARRLGIELAVCDTTTHEVRASSGTSPWVASVAQLGPKAGVAELLRSPDGDAWLVASAQADAACTDACRALLAPAAPGGAKTDGAPAEDAEAAVEQITRLFERRLLKRNQRGDRWEEEGRARFAASVRRWVKDARRVLFVLPCFPFKSRNTDSKVLGSLPDMAEFLALENLHEFFAELEALYPPGGKLVLFSDGRVYNACFGISNRATAAFLADVVELCPSPHIVWTDLQALIAGPTNAQTAAGLDFFGPDQSAVDELVAHNVDTRSTYLGFKQFLDFELPRGGETNKARRKMCGAVARRMIGRNVAMAQLIRLIFPDHVRLSIHPGLNVEKFGCNLVGATHFGTPWHNVAVSRPHGWELMHREDAEREGLQLAVETRGARQLAYFREVPVVDKLLAEVERVLWRGGTPGAPIEDRWASLGREKLRQSLEACVAAGRPIEATLLGFAHKWPGDPLSRDPDLGEEMALRTIHKLVMRIKAVYAPGCHFTVLSGGVLWHDLLGVPEAEMQRYAEKCKAMLARIEAERPCRMDTSDSETTPHTSDSESAPHTSDSESVPHTSDSESTPHTSDSESTPPFKPQFEAKQESSLPSMLLFPGVEFRTLYDDFPGLPAAAIRQELQRFAPAGGSPQAQASDAFRAKQKQFAGFGANGNATDTLLVQSEAFRRYAQATRPGAIQFSVRPTDNCEKFGMNLFGPAQAKLAATTPWHGVAVELSDKTVVCVPRSVAAKAGAEAFKRKDTAQDPPRKRKPYFGFRLQGDAEQALQQLAALAA